MRDTVTGCWQAVVQRQCHSCPSIQNYLRFDAVRDIDGINYTAVNRRDGTPLVSKLRWKPAFGPKKGESCCDPCLTRVSVRTVWSPFVIEIVFVVHSPGPSFIKARNLTSNYAVYWSQLTATIQCSLQPVS